MEKVEDYYFERLLSAVEFLLGLGYRYVHASYYFDEYDSDSSFYFSSDEDKYESKSLQKLNDSFEYFGTKLYEALKVIPEVEEYRNDSPDGMSQHGELFIRKVIK